MTTDFGGRSDGADDVAIQADGKIVAAGSGFPAQVRPLDFALARYNRDGTLDSTFGDGGKVLTTFEPNSIDGANAVLIQPDGKIVAGKHAERTDERVRRREVPAERVARREFRRGRPRGDADLGGSSSISPFSPTAS